MPRIFTYLLLFTATLFADIEVKVPRAVVSGEVSEYKILANESVSITSLPEVNGLEWGSPSRSSYTSIINGVRKEERSVKIAFRYTGSGPFTIPSFDVYVDGKKETLPARTIKVSSNPLEEMTDVEISFPGLSQAPESIVVGQELPVRVKYYVDANLKNEWTFPEVEVRGNGIVKEFKHPGVSTHDENYSKNFKAIGSKGSYKLERERHKGELYTVFTLETALVAQQTGEMSASIILPVEIETGRGFFNRNTKRYVLRGEVPTIKVESLPALQEVAFNLDLIGQWKLSSELSKNEVKLGYPFTFKLKIKGQGDIKRIYVPETREFDIPGFDIQKIDFSKESKPNGWEAELNFILSANSPDSKFPELKFASFNIETMKYDIYKAVHDLKVSVPTRAEQNAQSQVQSYKVPDQAQAKEELIQEPITQEDISYISKEELKLNPVLWKNIHPAYFILIPIAPLIFIVSLLLTVKKPEDVMLSKAQKLARKRALKEIASLKSLSGEALTTALNESCLPAIGKALCLGESATSDEVAKALKDESLAKDLADASHSSYLPGGVKSKIDASQLSESLMKAFKAMTIVLIMVLSTQQSYAETAGDLYAAEKYEEALEKYEQQIVLGELDPYLIYNAGNAAFKSADFAKALAYYEKAARLLPRDKRISFNLDLTRQKMELSDTRLSFVDVLRPDEWLNLALVFWAVFWLALVALRQLRSLNAVVIVVLLILNLLPLAMFFAQKHYSYEPRQALALTKAELYTAPNEEKQSDKRMKAGQSFIVEETIEVKGFSRIKLLGSEFWIKSEQVQEYWP